MTILSNDEVIGYAIQYTESSAFDLDMARSSIRKTLERNAWREFRTPNNNVMKYNSFADFITASRPYGLQMKVEDVQKLVANDNETVVMLREALLGKRGPKQPDSLPDNVRETKGDGHGNSSSYILSRLTRDHPELRAKVDAGELSASAAAIKAGFRPPTVSVRLDSTEAIARTLRKRLTTEQVQQLIQELSA